MNYPIYFWRFQVKTISTFQMTKVHLALTKVCLKSLTTRWCLFWQFWLDSQPSWNFFVSFQSSIFPFTLPINHRFNYWYFNQKNSYNYQWFHSMLKHHHAKFRTSWHFHPYLQVHFPRLWDWRLTLQLLYAFVISWDLNMSQTFQPCSFLIIRKTNFITSYSMTLNLSMYLWIFYCMHLWKHFQRNY